MATHVETVFGSATASASMVMPSVAGGSNLVFVLVVGLRPTSQSVTAVSGGGLTWIKAAEQLAGRNQLDSVVWYAFGSPSSFQATVTLDASTTTVIGSLSVYSGADSAVNGVWDWAAAVTAGTDTNSPSLTATPGTPGASFTYLNVVLPRNRNITTADADYTARGNASAGTAGDTLTIWAYDRAMASGVSDTMAQTLSSTADWISWVVFIKDASSSVDVTTSLTARSVTLTRPAFVLKAGTTYTLAARALALTRPSLAVQLGASYQLTARALTLTRPAYTLKTSVMHTVLARALLITRLPANAVIPGADVLVALSARHITLSRPVLAVSFGSKLPLVVRGIVLTRPVLTPRAGMTYTAALRSLTLSRPVPTLAAGVKIITVARALALSRPVVATTQGVSLGVPLRAVTITRPATTITVEADGVTVLLTARELTLTRIRSKWYVERNIHGIRARSYGYQELK